MKIENLYAIRFKRHVPIIQIVYTKEHFENKKDLYKEARIKFYTFEEAKKVVQTFLNNMLISIHSLKEDDYINFNGRQMQIKFAEEMHG